MSGLKNQLRKLEEDIIRRIGGVEGIETEAMAYSEDVKKSEVEIDEKNLEKDSVSDQCDLKRPKDIKNGVGVENEAIETLVKVEQDNENEIETNAKAAKSEKKAKEATKIANYRVEINLTSTEVECFMDPAKKLLLAIVKMLRCSRKLSRSQVLKQLRCLRKLERKEKN